MVDKIIYTYKFTNLPNIEVLKDECKIHKEYESKNVNREWYSLGDSDLKNIISLYRNYNIYNQYSEHDLIQLILPSLYLMSNF